jgi:hypothetical protein
VREDLDRTVRLTDPGEWRRGPGFVVSNAPLRRGEITVAGPLRLTSAARTLVDCAREWPLEAAVVAMDAALLAERTSPGELSAAAARAQRWPGAARARRAASFADGRAESVLESRGRLRILGAGFPAPALQVEISTSARLVGVVDAWFDDVAVAVEFDGQVKYTDPWRDRTPAQVLWEEKRREDELRALGIRLLRITDADLDRWPVLDDRLRRLLAEPGPAERRFTARPRTRGMRRTG